MFDKKPKTDAERLADAVRVLEKIRLSYAKDPWSFIGAVILEYHTVHTASKLGGQLEDFEKFESQLLPLGDFKVDGQHHNLDEAKQERTPYQ